jgi:hypothetical protein
VAIVFEAAFWQGFIIGSLVLLVLEPPGFGTV